MVELLVSISLFMIVAVTSIVALIALNDANKRMQVMRSIIDNLNFAVEDIARSMRLGTEYNCGAVPPLSDPRDCPGGDIQVSFKSFEGEQIVYRYNVSAQVIEKQVDGNSFLPIVSSQFITVDSLKFYVSGTVENDKLQPRMVIILSGTAKYSDTLKTSFELQTSVSQRMLDS